MTTPRAELWVFAVAWAAYALMAAGGGEWMDAGELTAAAFTLGGAHPPGHPGHSLLGKLATLLPVGEVAFRVNVLSGACMAAAVAGTVALGRTLVRGAVVPAVVGATLAALSPVITTNATRAEVYGPAAALLVWATVFVVRFCRGARAGIAAEAGPGAGTETGTETEAEAGTETEAEAGTEAEAEAEAENEAENETGTETETEAGTEAEAGTEPAQPAALVLAAGFLCALAVAFQPLIATATTIPLAIAIALAARKRVVRLAPPVVALGVLALLTYAYLPLRANAASPPSLMWGDPSTLERLQALLSAKAYQGNFAVAGLVERFAGLWQLVGEGAGLPLLFMGTSGLAFAALTGLRGAGVVLATATAVVAGASTQHYINPDMPGYVSVAVFLCAAGLAPIADAIARAAVSFAGGSVRRHVVHALVLVPIAGLAFFGPTARAFDGGSRRAGAGQPADGPRLHFEATVGQTPVGPAVFFATGDHSLFPAMYEQLVAGARPDVVVANDDLVRDIWFLRYLDRRLPVLYWPFIDDDATDAIASRAVAGNLRAGRYVGGDEPAFGKLDPRYAAPRGRAYAYQLKRVESTPLPPPPPRYPGGVGERVAAKTGLVRATFEATRGRLERVAVAAGLADTFDESAWARLEELSPQPLLYPLLPAVTPVLIFAPWQRDLVADDLAWRLGQHLERAARSDAGAGFTPERRLLSLWHRLLDGDDTAAAELRAAPALWRQATRAALASRLPASRLDALLGPAAAPP